ncbi:MAG TPA: HPr family phosphocarrier protein, partial [Nitrospinae bacterium]|nr:HPr family phosphocarrier protein [Nitrospinota bacterium]
MPEKTVAINNELGLHARAAAQFVRVSTQFECDIFVSWRDIEVDGK